MNKEVVVHTHNGVLAIKRNTFESDLIRWMNLGQERVRCMERVTWKLTLPYVK